MDNKKTICTFPWSMYSVDTGFGWWRSCPRVPYQKLTDTNFNNHERLVEQRQNLRNGVEDELCTRCWESQANNVKSYRQVLGQDKEHDYTPLNVVPVPRIFEVKFSNLCNLKCIFCSSRCSSLWEHDIPLDESEMGEIRGEELNKQILQYAKDSYEDITMFQFFGGEPIIVKEFEQMFDLILSQPISKGQKTISFSTNMFYPESYRETFENNIQKVLDKGHKLFMRFSIDGVREQGEYLRTNLQWDRFERNLDSFMNKFHDYPNVGRMRCNIAVNITNLVYLDTIIDYIVKKGLTNVEPHYNYVGKPEHFYMETYGSRLMPALEMIKEQNFYHFDAYKTHVIDLVETMIHLPPKLDIIQQGKDWLDNYDAQTGRKFLEIFPLNTYMYE